MSATDELRRLLDDAIEKSEQLAELANDFAPMVSIKNCKGCTFNIYPSRTTITEKNER